jgi:hypothetical protein
MEQAVDAIQHRYGWTDDEVGRLSFRRFRRICRIIAEREREEARERYRDGAWIAFQMGAGGDVTFGDYLSRMGLSEQEPVQDHTTAQEAIAKAEAILQRARERI